MKLTKKDKENLAKIGLTFAVGLGQAFVAAFQEFAETGEPEEREQLAQLVEVGARKVAAVASKLAAVARGGAA